MESGYPGFYTGWQTDMRFPVYRWLLQRQKKKKKKKISQLRNLVIRMHSLRGMKVARPTNGVDGRGCFKKRMPACNGQDRGLCFGPKGR